MAILAASLDSIFNILWVALGLGLVIFFHELGHFAVAKWCDVFVERFSIGFGPILLSKKWGETEYALSAIPFGGYVKMLGQDDMDPNQMASDEIAEDPRSYMAKKVWQRMAIISAGVIMNIVTGMGFFAAAFSMGVLQAPPIMGDTQVGMPAWTAGLELGDEIQLMNGKKVNSYEDIILGVALSSGPLELVVNKRDGETVNLSVTPDETGIRRMIGAGFPRSLEIPELIDDSKGSITTPGTAAARAEPPLMQGATVVRVGDRKVEHFYQMQDEFARNASESVELYLQEKEKLAGELTKVTIPPGRFREVGLVMDIGTIKFIKTDSPASKAGLRTGDKITWIDDEQVGVQIDPLRLPEVLAKKHGQNVVLHVRRESTEGAGAEKKPAGEVITEGDKAGLTKIEIVPDDIPAWIEQPSSPGTPMPAPSIGIAFEITRTVLSVKSGSPAEGKLQAGDRIQKLEFVLPKDAKPPEDKLTDEQRIIEFADPEHKDRPTDWSYPFWVMQSLREYQVKLTVLRGGEKQEVTLTPTELEASDWFLPIRGFKLTTETYVLKADSVGAAVQMGINHTKNKMLEIYSTLRSLVTGDLSVKNLHGPIGIAQTAYRVAKHGISELLLFLGILSVNLAVLNFLPIPVLDGGHMVFLLWEAITGKKPSDKVLVGATYVGVLFILGLIGLVMYLDIVVHGMGQ